MISWLNLLSGLGMIAVGAGAMAYWYWKKRTSPLYFLIGGVLWAAAIAIKLAMDLTITGPFYSQVTMVFVPLAAITIIGLYLGLRTGIFESGITYLAVKYTKLSIRMGFDDAVALGIGFGGTEAIVLGVLSLVNVAVFLLLPDLLDMLPASALEQFSLIFIPVPIIERLFALLCHVFATVLVVYAVKLNDLKWLAVSVAYKTLLDGALPLFGYFFKGMALYAPAELYVAALGIAGLAGLYWLKKQYEGRAPAEPKPGG